MNPMEKQGKCIAAHSFVNRKGDYIGLSYTQYRVARSGGSPGLEVVMT